VETKERMMGMGEKRITIFTGNFGSGKTEVSINYALKLAKEEKERQVALVDLDIVNPYFRSREARKLLEKNGVKVIIPGEDLVDADLPIITPGILGVIQNPCFRVVFDVGGDDVGATALGRFHKYFRTEEYEHLLVVNPFRPFTRDVAGIKDVLQAVEKASRLKISGLVSNPNLGCETNYSVVLQGNSIVEDTSKKLELPIKFLSATAENLPAVDFDIGCPIFPIKIYLLVPWYDDNSVAPKVDTKLRLRF